METSNLTATDPPKAAHSPPSFLTLAPELREQIYMYLFANQATHEIRHTQMPSPRSGQILRVCRAIYNEALVVLYRESAFLFGPMYPQALPPRHHLVHIRTLTIETNFALVNRLDDYPALQSLTLSIPSFRKDEWGADALLNLRLSPVYRWMFNQARLRPNLEIATEGETGVYKDRALTFIRKRTIVKEAKHANGENKKKAGVDRYGEPAQDSPSASAEPVVASPLRKTYF